MSRFPPEGKDQRLKGRGIPIRKPRSSGMCPAKTYAEGAEAPSLQLTCPKGAQTDTITVSLLFRLLHYEYLQTYPLLPSNY